MMNRRLVILFFLVSLLYIISEILQLRMLVSVARVSLIPIVFFSYLFHKENYHPLIFLLLFLYLSGDIASLLNFETSLKLALLFFGLGHIIFIRFCFDMMQDLRLRRLLFSALPVIILWFVYYNYSIKDIFGEQLGNLLIPVILYSIVLSLFTIISLMSFFNKENNQTLFALIIAVTFLVGDVIHGVNQYFIQHWFFELVNIVAQIFGYYFLMKFIQEYELKQKW